MIWGILAVVAAAAVTGLTFYSEATKRRLGTVCLALTIAVGSFAQVRDGLDKDRLIERLETEVKQLRAELRSGVSEIKAMLVNVGAEELSTEVLASAVVPAGFQAPAARGGATVLVIDTTGSMRGLPVQEAVASLLSTVPSDAPLGIITFDTNGATVLPVGRHTVADVNLVLRSLKFDGRHTNTLAGLEMAGHAASTLGRGARIVLVTDGLYAPPPDAEVPAHTDLVPDEVMFEVILLRESQGAVIPRPYSQPQVIWWYDRNRHQLVPRQ